MAEVEALEDGEQQGQQGVPHPESPVNVHRGAKKKQRVPAATSQMLCCPGVWEEFLFKAGRPPLLLTSSAWGEKKGKLDPKADVRLSAAEGPHPPLSVYSDHLGQDWTFIFGDKSRLTFRIIPRPHPNATSGSNTVAVAVVVQVRQ